jgi:hypothetical protein
LSKTLIFFVALLPWSWLLVWYDNSNYLERIQVFRTKEQCEHAQMNLGGNCRLPTDKETGLESDSMWPYPTPEPSKHSTPADIDPH